MIYRILTVKENGGAYRVAVSYEDKGSLHKRRLTVSKRDYEEADCPSVGDEVDDDVYRILCRETDVTEALERAYSLLDFSDNSEAALRQKLLRRGYLRESIDEAIATLKARNVLSDEALLSRYVVSLAEKKLYGRRKIVAALLAKGFRADDVRHALDNAVACGDVDFDAIRSRLIEKKLGASPDKEEVYALLRKQGF